MCPRDAHTKLKKGSNVSTPKSSFLPLSISPDFNPDLSFHKIPSVGNERGIWTATIDKRFKPRFLIVIETGTKADCRQAKL